ncbi:hypothetical protein C0J52_01147 [Blattella germanica]|nr:hypothetical protein C0J52_01147 [Blattella germanica]
MPPLHNDYGAFLITGDDVQKCTMEVALARRRSSSSVVIILVIIIVLSCTFTSAYKVVSDNDSDYHQSEIIAKEGAKTNNDSDHEVDKRETELVRSGRLLGGRHRLRMIFPLLLNIASRLAQVVMLTLASMASTFVMAALAKKAFIISLAAFGIMVYDMYYKKRERVHYHIPIPKHHETTEGHGNEPYNYMAHAESEHLYNWGISDNKKLVPPKPNLVRNTQYIDFDFPITEASYSASGGKKKGSASHYVHRTRK